MAGQTITIDDFGNGIDRRLGQVSRVANKFRDVHNYVITPGRKLKRRPPMRNVSGLIDVQCQIGRFINGSLIVIAPAGATIQHTVTTFPVRTVFFDVPDRAAGDWQLLDVSTFNEQIVAVIKHRFDSAAAPWRTSLHVWNDVDPAKLVHPTYVEDPACPTTWGPNFPFHVYGDGEKSAGSYVNYAPRMAVSGDRVYLSRPDGNVAFSGTGSPRIWNTRSPEEILADGRWWYFISTNGGGDQTVALPVPYYDLKLDGRYAAYVLEYCNANGTWTQMREQTLLSTYEDFKIAPLVNRWKASDPPETKLTYRLPGDGRVFRFRALAKPPAAVQTGLYIRPDLSVVGGVLTHTGDSDLIASFDIPGPLTASSSYYISVPVAGAPIPIAPATLGAPGSMPLNGQQRYWQRIIANALTDGAGTALLYAITGTATITVGGTRVVGTSTLFKAEFEVGRQIEINGERRNVAFIGSDTDLEVDAPFTTAYTGIALRDPRYRYAFEVGDTGNEWYSTQEADVTFKEAGKDDAGYLGTAMYDSSGERPICIATMQNRLLVQFPAALQAWGVGPDALADMRLLAIDGQAAGNHTSPQPALIDGLTALPTANGVRLFDPTGNSKDYIDFTGVGDMLRGIPLPNLQRAVWWPYLRTYLTCAASTGDADTVFYCLTRHKDTKVLGWETFSFKGIIKVDAMFLRGDDLVIVQNYALYVVTALDTTYRDDTDTDEPFQSRARSVFCDLGSPQKNKKLTACDIVQVGKARLSIYMNPFREDEVSLGPVVAGVTSGRQRCPLGVMGPGISIEISSTDVTGHELDAVSFDYQLLNR